jgi:hypothetical protein
MHDFEIVAILDTNLGQQRPRHDLEIAFHRDPLGIEAEAAHHLGHACSVRHSAVLAIDPDSKAAGLS